jgi:hypothetical protein
MKISKVISQRIMGLERLIKFFGLGKNDVQEIPQVGPHGIDSVPPKDMVAVYSETSIKGDSVVIGYLNRSLVANEGEFRTYSTDENGTVKFYIWQKNDGTAEIGGNSDNLVRYSPLNSGFGQLRSDLNDIVANFNQHIVEYNAFVTAYNAHTHTVTVIGAPTGPALVPASPSAQTAIPSTASITNSKIDEIKTL